MGSSYEESEAWLYFRMCPGHKMSPWKAVDLLYLLGSCYWIFPRPRGCWFPVWRALSLRLSFSESCHVSPKLDQIPFLRDRELTQSLFWISVPTSWATFPHTTAPTAVLGHRCNLSKAWSDYGSPLKTISSFCFLRREKKKKNPKSLPCSIQSYIN